MYILMDTWRAVMEVKVKGCEEPALFFELVVRYPRAND